MVVNKNQHFIPQFYLRNFSNNGKQIGIYNIAKNRFVKNGTIKHEASEDYFYGKGDFDDALTTIEARAANVLKEIVESNSLPQRFSAKHNVIISFTILLKGRTKHSQEKIDEMVNKFTKLLLLKNFTEEQSNLVKVSWKNGVLMSVQEYARALPLSYDLDYKLVINKTPVDFITSDNPVVFYNQFFEIKNSRVNNTGLTSKGLEIFFPISPKLCLMFFDGNVYGVGSKGQNLVETSNLSDVDFINMLQYLNANENLYFGSKISEDYFIEVINKSSRFRNNDKYNVDEIYKKSEFESLVMFSEKKIRCGLKLSFIRILRRSQNLQVGNSLTYPRSKELVLLSESLEEKYRNK